MLTIVTLGIYYPWAKVRNLRYLYGNTTLESRNFEYHATGKQIFMGYLIAMALFIIFTIIQQFSPEGSLILTLILFIAIPWIIWRSLMFSMRMTSFSNVRFSFNGSLGGAYFCFMLLPLLMLIVFYGPIAGMAVLAPTMMGADFSVGYIIGFIAVIIGGIVGTFFLYAFFLKRHNMYVINGSHFGQGQFSAELETSAFAKIILMEWTHPPNKEASKCRCGITTTHKNQMGSPR